MTSRRRHGKWRTRLTVENQQFPTIIETKNIVAVKGVRDCLNANPSKVLRQSGELRTQTGPGGAGPPRSRTTSKEHRELAGTRQRTCLYDIHPCLVP